jgi:hypothetical protein
MNNNSGGRRFEVVRILEEQQFNILLKCYISLLCVYIYFFSKYHSGDQVKKTEIGRTCSTYGESKGAYRVLVGKPEGRRPRGRLRRRWEDNIKMNLREVGWKHGVGGSG